MEAAKRDEILSRYADHARRFDEVAARRQPASAGRDAEVVSAQQRRREVEREPRVRELEMLHLIADGLTNREISRQLYLSEETVKSHIRGLLLALPARSRAHAVAVGFRRGMLF
jgi:DNA-binding NarL/FixJ family response regulator